MASIQIKTYQSVFGVLGLLTLSNPWVLSGVAAQADGSGTVLLCLHIKTMFILKYIFIR
jgi:hypothetical protein